MNIARFDSVEAMEHQARQLLEEHFQYEASGPHAVMLTGGRTPVGLYRDLAAAQPVANDQLHILVSDERHVPLDSPDCNYSHMSEMVQGIGVDDSRVIRVHTELELDEAADRYDRELTAFFDAGGRITLGILGLGADGHVASLFSFDDIDRGVGRNAISVPRTPGPDRISVTSDLLVRAETLVFLVAGAEKRLVIEKIIATPDEVIASRATRAAANVQLWFSY